MLRQQPAPAARAARAAALPPGPNRAGLAGRRQDQGGGQLLAQHRHRLAAFRDVDQGPRQQLQRREVAAVGVQRRLVVWRAMCVASRRSSMLIPCTASARAPPRAGPPSPEANLYRVRPGLLSKSSKLEPSTPGPLPRPARMPKPKVDVRYGEWARVREPQPETASLAITSSTPSGEPAVRPRTRLFLRRQLLASGASRIPEYCTLGLMNIHCQRARARLHPGLSVDQDNSAEQQSRACPAEEGESRLPAARRRT